MTIDGSQFVCHDLTKPLNLDRRFDLVMSLEVAEHLDSRFAPVFVESLVRHGDVVLYSAAVPGQGGNHHVNEQWPSYWVELFAEHDFRPYDVLRGNLWGNPAVEWWYQQNCLIFASAEAAARLGLSPSSAPIDIVHPTLLALKDGPPSPLRSRLTDVATQIKGSVGKSPLGPPLRTAMGALAAFRHRH